MNNYFREGYMPRALHLELTEACQEKCIHCYNFCREAKYVPKHISYEDIEFYIKGFKDIGGTHIILTGGEPLLVIDKLLYALDLALENNMTVNINSNMMAASKENLNKLKNHGVEHILTTLFSFDPKTHDYISSTKGAFNKTWRGIYNARDIGIRFSINMIVNKFNNTHVYQTGELLNRLGIKKFIANRIIPSSFNKDIISEKQARLIVSDMLKLEHKYSMNISTCRMIPYCFFSDINDCHKYTHFRGCNAGKRHMVVGINGSTKACVHESLNYGNVKEIGFKQAWKNMYKWRRKDFLPKVCQECEFIDLCEGGCRQVAEIYVGDWTGKDNLCRR